MRTASSLTLTFAVFAGACAPAARHMTRMEGRAALAAPPDKALVVFVRPSGFASGISANVLDENGAFLGDSVAESQFAVALPPGPHLFTVWAENTDALQAELAPGKIYFVEVQATMGAFSAQFHLKAIKPGVASWAQRDAWMSRTTQYRPDFAGGNAELAGKGDKVQERLRRAREHAAKWDERARFERTLGPGDGL